MYEKGIPCRLHGFQDHKWLAMSADPAHPTHEFMVAEEDEILREIDASMCSSLVYLFAGLIAAVATIGKVLTSAM